MEEERKRPGGQLARRPLNFIWLSDCSGSMSSDGKIQQLNTAIRNAIPDMRKVASENPQAEVLIQSVKFSNGATWHIANPTPVDNFEWKDLTAEGETAMGKALKLVADEMIKLEKSKTRGFPPVLVLVSDGQPTDNFEEGLKALLNTPWGTKAVRMAIAIGGDADLNVLRNFINNPEIEPLKANNADALHKYIKFVSTEVLKAASTPPSQPKKGTSTGNVPIPTNTPKVSTDDVW